MSTADAARSRASSIGHYGGSRDNALAPTSVRTTIKGGVGSSTTSVASGEDGPPDDGSAGNLHASSDGNLDRLKNHNHGSEDSYSESSSTHRRRMSKLFKGRRTRRKSGHSNVSDSADDAIPPVPNMPNVPNMPSASKHGLSASEESLGLHKSVSSSLLTEDSDAEGAPVRPGVSPHQSHTGYLTLSSPLIAAQTVDSAPSESATADELATPRHAQTFDVAVAKRGTSPGRKLKEAFTPTPKRSSTQKPGGDTVHSPRPSTSGGLGSLFGGKKREATTTISDNSPLQQSPPPLPATKEVRSSSSLPVITPKLIVTELPATPPNLVHAPTTLVTPPTPTDAKPSSPAESASSSKNGAQPTNPNVVVSPSGNMISHRRARSATNPPSKLSNSVSAPLTPTIEEAKTPGGTAVPPQSPSGFFSSVFSAAQNAANTLSTTIANTTTTGKAKGPAQQHKGEEPKAGVLGGEEVISANSPTTTANEGPEKRELAVETLGTGNLSLAHLGIAESEEVSPMSSNVNLPVASDDASARAADLAAAQAVSAAYAAEKPARTSHDDRAKPQATTSANTMSPPRQSDIMDSPAPGSIHRQGSIRSRVSGGRKRRHRGSSATTGNTIAAAIGASTSTLVPQAGLNNQRLNGTGFAVASPKRNREFHALFKSVPEDDYLIEDYSAALQKEILLQGRLYVSEGHLCFSSNILGWVTNLVISFDEVVSVEKKSTAVVFPNAIVIQTLHARNVFASLLTRDTTYDLIIGIWKISHPNLKSSLNGVALDGSGTGDKTEKAESVGSEDGSVQESEDDVYDEDAEDDDGMGSFTDAGEGSVTGSEIGSVGGEARNATAAISQAVSGGTQKLSESAETTVNGTPAVQDFPGAVAHAPTECGDNDQHYDKLLIDTTIPAPLGKIYSLMFGPGSGVFMRKWLLEDQKSTDLQMEDDGKGVGEGTKTFSFSYIKPLGGSIGPKQTKCNITSNLEQYDLNKAVTVLQTTQTPDVPSGNIFVTKTRYCLMWGPNNSTRLIMTFTVEWSGKSWLRAPIEKGANDGQLTYATSLSTALRNAVAAKNSVAKVPGKPGKGKKRSKVNTTAATDAPVPATSTAVAPPKEKSWGFLDPLRSLLGPVADIIDLIFTKQNLILFLAGMLMYTWFFPRSHGVASSGYMTAAQRQVAYEELWRHEEAELWNWLEERIGMDRVYSSVASGRVASDQQVQNKLVAESMQERQIDDAIRTTEQRLSALKRAVKRERETSTKSPREEST